MSPDYLMQLADLADPDQLWRRSGIDRRDFTDEQQKQVDMGVALRRHAGDVRRLRDLLGTGQSLLLTPLSANGRHMQTVPTPAKILKWMGAR